MSAKILDGKALASKYREALIKEINSFVKKGLRPPCLAVVIVGDDPASHVYVKSKEKACASIGMSSRLIALPAQTTQEAISNVLHALAHDSDVDGILLQLPVPKHLDTAALIECIPAGKDVDGLTIESQGRLAKNQPGFLPCTPYGVMELLRSENIPLQGALAVVIGRSTLVGAPVTRLLEQSKATTISIASNTVEPHKLAAQADILIVAAGFRNLVGPHWIKPGAAVIDVGMHRAENGLCGDVDYAGVKEIAGWITPVPGGVGPMTIAMLLKNCWQAYQTRMG